eukprot:scaffold193957_cov26-Tisochrysis_lutea.AAC.2
MFVNIKLSHTIGAQRAQPRPADPNAIKSLPHSPLICTVPSFQSFHSHPLWRPPATLWRWPLVGPTRNSSHLVPAQQEVRFAMCNRQKEVRVLRLATIKGQRLPLGGFHF